MYESKPYFYGTGRRKHSVARVRVYNGTGKVTINGRDMNDYFGLETLKLLVNTALGFLALWAVNATAAITGVALGLNLLNALTIGVLGLPGFVLLLLAQWVL